MVMGETIHAERGRNFALGALDVLRYTPKMLHPSPITRSATACRLSNNELVCWNDAPDEFLLIALAIVHTSTHEHTHSKNNVAYQYNQYHYMLPNLFKK